MTATRGIPEAETYLYVPKVGDIVESTDKALQWYHLKERRRGLVIRADGEGIPEPLGMPPTTGFTVRISIGYHAVSHHENRMWRKVPRAQWTAEERVASVLATWAPPEDHVKGERMQDYQTIEWQMLMAIVGDARFEEWTEMDWPDTDELWLMVARHFDEKVEAAKTLGRALGRLG